MQNILPPILTELSNAQACSYDSPERVVTSASFNSYCKLLRPPTDWGYADLFDCVVQKILSANERTVYILDLGSRDGTAMREMHDKLSACGIDPNRYRIICLQGGDPNDARAESIWGEKIISAGHAFRFGDMVTDLEWIVDEETCGAGIDVCVSNYTIYQSPLDLWVINTVSKILRTQESSDRNSGGLFLSSRALKPPSTGSLITMSPYDLQLPIHTFLGVLNQYCLWDLSFEASVYTDICLRQGIEKRSMPITLEAVVREHLYGVEAFHEGGIEPGIRPIYRLDRQLSQQIFDRTPPREEEWFQLAGRFNRQSVVEHIILHEQ